MANIKYRPLEESYIKYGYQFNLIKREGQVAIYEQVETDSGRRVAYEVFEVIQAEEGFVGPNKYHQPARELVPNSESWGAKGFTPNTLDRAEYRFQQIKERLANREVMREEVEKTSKKSKKK